MRIQHAPFSIRSIAAAAAVCVLAACASNALEPAQPVRTQATRAFHRSGVLSQGWPRALSPIATALRPAGVQPPADLYVSDATGAVDVLNSQYVRTGMITAGLTGPDGERVDQSGNLYVADYANGYVEEYANGSNTPEATYGPIVDPVDVAIDRAGHVYVVSLNDFNSPSTVTEFAQGGGTTLQTFPVAYGSAESAAIDAKGNLYVAYWNYLEEGAGITVFPGGNPNRSHNLKIQFAGPPGGMITDGHDNIVMCIQQYQQSPPVGEVVSIPRSRGVINVLATGLGGPFHLALNKAETLLYVADYTSEDVTVLSYPSGAYTSKIASGDETFSDPLGVAAYKAAP
jgi:sugar lactone lactonase YvrE